MEVKAGHLGRDLPAEPHAEELFEALIERSGVLIERIVSWGQTTPDAEWYDQAHNEFVLVVAGAARLRIAAEDEDRTLQEGDWIFLPAHCRHRVTWTESDPRTVWLTVHFKGK